MTYRALVVASLILVLAAPARADEDTSIPGHTIDRKLNGGISGLATGIGLVSQLIPIRSYDLWHAELMHGEEDLHDNFSPRAASIADALLGLDIGAPAIYLLGNSIDDADGDKLLIYGQSLAINAMIAGVTKRLVQRPRPYTYSRDPVVRKYVKAQGDDAFMSFYSGHSALAFGAATTGAYLLGASGATPAQRAFAVGGGYLIAATTANLRVRAGKHFYSDVILGSAIGIAVGYAVPALHADNGTPYKPSGLERGAGVAGILGGILLGRLIPLEKRESELDRKPGLVHDLQVTPMAVNGGMGFAIGGGI